MQTRLAIAGFVAGLVAGAGGCAGPSPALSGGRTVVATSVAPITDIVHEVVGDHAEVVALIPEGADSHTFEPTPSTLRRLARADVLFVDGLHLEDSIVRHARSSMKRGGKVVALGEQTLTPGQYAFDTTFPRDAGDPNPHVWMDPVYARQWSEFVRDTMVRIDAPNADGYRANQARFAAAVDALHAAITAAAATVPSDHRKLLTYHDSFAYFARRYGFEVIGAIQPADFSEPSAREVQALIGQVRAAGVRAVFGSEVFPSPVLARIANETGARYVDALRDDVLPTEHTYVAMLVDDVTTIVQALGGDASALAAVPRTATWR